MPLPAAQPGAPAEDPRGTLHAIASADELRRRFVRVGLVGGAVAALLGALDPKTPALAVGLRAAVVGACVVGLLRLRRTPDLTRLARALTIVFTGGVLGLALARLPERWPLVLTDLVPVLIYSMLLVGPRLAMGLAAASVAGVLGALFLPGVPTPPHLGPQLYGLLAPLALSTFYFSRFADAVAAGAAELAASVRALEAARRDTAELARLLSEQVAHAVEALARAVRGNLEGAQAASNQAVAVLEESKRRMPGEPELPEFSLPERLHRLRHQAMDLSIAMLFTFDALGVARMAWQGPRENLPVGLAGLATVLLAAAIRWRRPAWRRPVTLTMWIAGFLLSMPLLWGWYERAPVPPPPLTPQLTTVIFLGALYGLRPAWACLGAALVVNLVALRLYPGVVPADVLGVFVVYALATWVVWQWPRALLEALRTQRQAAVESIRARRRLVATLFHDLANPMMVVSTTLELAARGHPEPDQSEVLGDMVERMQASLASALSGRVRLQAIEAGRLCDEVEHLFRGRLANKHVVLEVAGARDARLRGDVALLRDSVLANLVSNALKFSPEGSTIDLTVRREDDAVSLLVEDRGPGLPEEVSSALASGHDAPSRPGSAGEAGSGHGLRLAQDYLAAMGGQLDLAPRPGGGLTARVRLPPA